MNKWVDYQEKSFSLSGQDIAKRAVNSDRIKKSLKFINPGEMVLDLGCNDGSITNLIHDKKCEAIGVDLPEIIKIAKSNFPDIEFLSFSLEEKFPLKDMSFDCVFAGSIIEHIMDDNFFLEECFRVLRDNGKLILTTANVAYIRDRAWLLFGRFVDCDAHIHLYTFRNLRKKLKSAGFKKIIEIGVNYDLGEKNILLNFLNHFKYGYQNPFWYLIELLLPKNFKCTIISIAVK